MGLCAGAHCYLDVEKRVSSILRRHSGKSPRFRDQGKRTIVWGRDSKVMTSDAQENLPAQYPAEKAEARFPRPDEDPGRPSDPQVPARQGPGQALGLIGSRRAPPPPPPHGPGLPPRPGRGSPRARRRAYGGRGGASGARRAEPAGDERQDASGHRRRAEPDQEATAGRVRRGRPAGPRRRRQSR